MPSGFHTNYNHDASDTHCLEALNARDTTHCDNYNVGMVEVEVVETCLDALDAVDVAVAAYIHDKMAFVVERHSDFL